MQLIYPLPPGRKIAKDMKIALINPKDHNPDYSKMVNLKNAFSYNLSGYNLGLLTISALTPETYETVLIDENYEQIDFSKDYDVVAISAMTNQANRAYEIAKQFRELGRRVVIGGIHATLLPEEVKQHADSVIIGEGENIWSKFLEDVRNKNVKPYYKSTQPVDLTMSPSPAYSRIDFRKYPMIWMQTSRGCVYKCDFCAASNIYDNKIRYKITDQIINELTEINKYANGNQEFVFADDNFLMNKAYARKIIKILGKAGLNWAAQTNVSVAEDEDFIRFIKDNGCKRLFMGFETLSSNGNKKGKFKYISKYEELIKTVHSCGIEINGGFIVGFDHDTTDTFKQIVDFITRNNIEMATMSVLTPLPGTQLRDRLLKEKRIISNNWDNYDFSSVVFTPKNMTPQELREGVEWIYNEFEKIILMKNSMLQTSYPSPPVIQIKNNGSLEKIKIHRFSCYNHKSWALMPKVLDRIKLFCDKYDTETKPAILIPQIRQMFATDSPYLGLWGIIDENGEIIGHILVTVEQYCNEPFLLIMQAECVNNIEITKKTFNEVIKWGRDNKIKKMHITTERLPETFIRKYKFRKMKTILIKDI